MGLTRRQAAIINHIIQEEVQGVLRGRSERDGYLYRGKLLEESMDPMSESWDLNLTEAKPHPDRVDDTLIKGQIREKLEDVANELAGEMLGRWKQALLPIIARAINEHDLLDLDFPISGRRLEDDLDEYGENEITDVEMEHVGELSGVLAKFSDAIVEMVISMAGGPGYSDDGER